MSRMQSRRSRILRRSLLVLATVVGLASCRTVRFYAQAAKGQWEMLGKARPIPEVLADKASSPKLVERLKLVQDLRDFARQDLHLPADKQFADYTDLGRPYAVWVVFASKEFSVEPVGWWYPLVGTLSYRGYFDPESALAEGEKLKAQGLDVYVGGTDAYSTLGWFADPVLNTFLRRSDADLAELVFHELTHAKIFIPGDTDFNEALATTVGQAGVRKWLRSRGRLKDLHDYELELRKDQEIVSLLLGTRAELEKLYKKSAPDETLRQAKAATFQRMLARYAHIKGRWTGESRYDRFFEKPMNNARLNTVATYYDLVPDFEKLLGRCQGDIDTFLARVEAMKALPREKRRETLAKAP